MKLLETVKNVSAKSLNIFLIAGLGLTFGSNLFADALPGQLLVQSQTPGSVSYRINAFDSFGNVLQTIVPPVPPMSGDSQNPRDLVVSNDGQIHLYNGTFDPYVSTYSPNTNSWSHQTHSGWSTINNVSYGGIVRFDNNVIVTNMSTAGNPSSGLVVIDQTTGDSMDIGIGFGATDVTRGLDDSLWVLGTGSFAFEFDSTTFEAGRMVNLSAAIGNDIRSIAVDGNGDFYVGDWGGSISRLDSDGNLVSSLSPGAGSIIDVDVSSDGLLAFGTRLDGAWLTDTSFGTPLQVESGRWNSFVTFVSPNAIPEPSTGIVVVTLFAASLFKRRR